MEGLIGGLLGATLVISATPGISPAQVTALEPGQGGADFRIQGEYSGKLETVLPLGMQVVALGGGRFRAHYLPGGLPGEGWDGAVNWVADGNGDSSGAAFQGLDFTAEVNEDGSLITGRTADGQLFSLNKVFRQSPRDGSRPPDRARVLFDGVDLSAWKAGTASLDDRGFLRPEGAGPTGGARTEQAFQDFTLHLEFRIPFMPEDRGPGRGNSGVYLQGRYELQVIDSFGGHGEGQDGTLRKSGAFFELAPTPATAPTYPPLSWQTCDVEFTAARFAGDGKTLVKSARATVLWNGVPIHTDLELAQATPFGDPQGPEGGPLVIQAGNPVFYRNIWILESPAGAAIRPGGRGAATRPGPEKHRGPAARLDGRMIGDLSNTPSIRPVRGYFLAFPLKGE